MCNYTVLQIMLTLDPFKQDSNLVHLSIGGDSTLFLVGQELKALFFQGDRGNKSGGGGAAIAGVLKDKLINRANR